MLAVAFAPPAWAASSAALEALELLKREHWRPIGAEVEYLAAPLCWWRAAELVLERSRANDAVILFGARRGLGAMKIARFARNEAAPLADDYGQTWPGRLLDPIGPAVRAPSLDARRLERALALTGARVRSDADGDGYIYNRCFYALLAAPNAPPAALMRLPISVESGRREGVAAQLNRIEIAAGVAAALAFAAAAGEAALQARRIAG